MSQSVELSRQTVNELPEHTGPRAVPAARGASRALLGPLLMFALFALFYTVPPQGADRLQHLSAIIEARDAMLEGQFPPRVAPRMGGGRRYPLFQFYGALPYTTGGALMLVARVDAYTAWRVVTFLCVTGAGFYAYRCGLLLTRQTWAAVVGGVVFVAAPYLSTDFRARFAYTEAVAFCLLPAVLYYSLRAFISPRRAGGAIVAGGVAWAGVALAHNITYLYASPLIALFFVSMLGRDLPKYARRLLRVGACWAVGLVLVAWYVGSQLGVLKYIAIANTNAAQTPQGSTVWAPLYAILSPVLTVAPEARNTPALGVQVGWPILAGVALAMVRVGRAVVRRRKARARRGLRTPGTALMIRLLVSFALAFFIVWSPVNFWRLVPSLFYNLQITYRILMFVVLWGSLLTALSLAALWRDRPGGMPAGAAWGCVLVVAIAAMPFQGWDLDRFSSRSARMLEASPVFGAENDVYFTVPGRMERFRVQAPPGADVVTAPVKPGRVTRASVPDGRPRIVQLPVIFYPGLQEVRDNGRRVMTVGQIDGLLALEVAPGRHEMEVRFVGSRWANWVSGVAWGAMIGFAIVALLRSMRRRRVVRNRAAPAFGARAALAGAALMVVPMWLPAARVTLKRRAAERAMGLVLASSEAFPGARPLNAFDGDPQTEWVTIPGPSAWMVILPPAPKVVSAVELEPRRTQVLGGWEKVRVVLYRGSEVVGDRTFELPEAHKQAVQVLEMGKATAADGIELRFSDPVTRDLAGARVIPPDFAYCGYREIRIR